MRKYKGLPKRCGLKKLMKRRRPYSVDWTTATTEKFASYNLKYNRDNISSVSVDSNMSNTSRGPRSARTSFGLGSIFGFFKNVFARPPAPVPSEIDSTSFGNVPPLTSLGSVSNMDAGNESDDPIFVMDSMDLALQSVLQEISSAISVGDELATPEYDRLLKMERKQDLLRQEKLKLLDQRRVPKARVVALPEGSAEVIASCLSQRVETVVNTLFDADITVKDISTLEPGIWLNDEVINCFMNFIMDRSRRSDHLPKVHCFNTFFFMKLSSSQGYDSVKRWTRRVNIFDQDILVIPIHRSAHWVCGIIDLRAKSFLYFDSLGGSASNFFPTMSNYLNKESQDKRNANYDSSDWAKLAPKNIPHQRNGHDCGVFTISYAECYTRKSGIDPIFNSKEFPNYFFDFDQSLIPALRRKYQYEIITGSLLPEEVS